MKRGLQVITLVFVILVVFSRSAEADLWDWLDQLSGPGPFSTRGNAAFTVHCNRSGPGSGWLQLLDSAGSRGPCVFVDIRRFTSREDDKFFRVNVTIAEVGPSYRIAPPFEIGFGAGIFHIASRGESGNQFTLSFPRLVFMPLFLKESWQKHSDLSFFQAYFRQTRIIGELNEEDFRLKPGQTFSVRHDGVASAGFIIDFVALGHAVRRWTQ